MGSIADLVPGRLFGNLRILRRVADGPNCSARFSVRCERVLENGTVCGTEKEVNGSNVACGVTVSCGCWRNKMSHGAARKGKRTGAMRSWTAMKQRPKVRSGYVDRVVCEGYDKSFESFLADLGERPEGIQS
jgi:hypothetical protein